MDPRRGGALSGERRGRCRGGEDFYDHDADPYEWTNLAARPDLAGTKARLRRKFTRMSGPSAPAR